MKPSPHKKRILGSPLEVENETIHMLHLEIRHVDDVKLKYIQMEITLIIIFEEWVFERLEAVLDVYHHFGSEREHAIIQTTMKEYELVYKEMVVSQMLEVNIFVKYFF